MTVVAVTGAAGRLGRRVLPLVASDPEVSKVVAIDLLAVARRPPKVEPHQADLTTADLDTLLHGVDVVIHLAFASQTELDEVAARAVNVGGTSRLFDAAGRAGVKHAVVLSSATVYGAWPNNAVPLTEEAPLRPNGELAYAVHKAQIERIAVDWRDGAPSERTVALLRPAVALAEGDSSWLARSLAAAAGLRAADTAPPVQFVHLDDVASAVQLAVRRRLQGAYNVAPEGWISAETARALAGVSGRMRLPARLAARVAEWSWELRLGPIPPGLLPYTEHPWVIASDRLRAEGWTPANTNEEAYVAGTEGSRWSMMTPKRKQELALGASGVALLLSGTAVAWLARRAKRGR
jgi:nucleoside-diphosphate-sugar epimerase